MTGSVSMARGGSFIPSLDLFLRAAREIRALLPLGRVSRVAPGGTIAHWKEIPKTERFSDEIDEALAQFADGANPVVGRLARKLVEAVRDRTSEPEVTVDDVDGALAFDLRLRSGDLMFGELQADGSLSVTVFDDRSEPASVKKHLSLTNESRFLEFLQSPGQN